MADRDDEPRAVWHRVRLRAGHDVIVRSLCPVDRAELSLLFDELSSGSRYQRFLNGKPSVSDRALGALVDDVDHVDHEALVAVTTDGVGRVIGEGRWIRDDDDPAAAELAITVADQWQQHGLGAALAEDLAGRAAAQGIDRFTAEVLTDNEGIHRLVERVGEVESRPQGPGVSELKVSTAGHDDPLEKNSALRRLLRSAAAGDFLVLPRPLRFWLRLTEEITKTLLVPVEVMLKRR